jgi:anti-sigma regulatory factor (Ser/Thr protein kinase)
MNAVDHHLMRRAWPARPEHLIDIRAVTRAWLEALGLPADVVDDVVCAVNEAATNSIEHAYLRQARGSVEIEFRADGGKLRVEVSDRGRWREAVVASGEPPDHRGFGLVMMRGLMDAVQVQSGQDGTRVSLTLARA